MRYAVSTEWILDLIPGAFGDLKVKCMIDIRLHTIHSVDMLCIHCPGNLGVFEIISVGKKNQFVTWLMCTTLDDFVIEMMQTKTTLQQNSPEKMSQH